MGWFSDLWPFGSKMQVEYVVETNSGSLYKIWMVDSEMFFLMRGKVTKVDGFAQKGGFPATFANILPGRVIQFNEKQGQTSIIVKVYKKILE